MSNKLEITKSSGNVFADLELLNPDEHLAKAQLAYQINKLLASKKLNQIQAAKLLGIDQPKISALNRGQLSGFSMERLFKYLNKLDQEVEIIVRPHEKTAKRSNKLKKSAAFLHIIYA